MGFLRRIAGILGFLKDDPHEVNDADDDNRANKEEIHRPTKGVRSQVPVAVERPHLGPVLAPCNPGDGGVQGLRWYAKRLRIDEDGDVADEFLEEILLETSSSTEDHRPLPRFEVKYRTRPAKVRNQVTALDGKLHHSVEYQGKLQWV